MQMEQVVCIRPKKIRHKPDNDARETEILGVLGIVFSKKIKVVDIYKCLFCCPCSFDPCAHRSDDAACSLTRLGKKSCDRDVLASLNMVSCALRAPSGRTRPEHLCRSKRIRRHLLFGPDSRIRPLDGANLINYRLYKQTHRRLDRRVCVVAI